MQKVGSFEGNALTADPISLTQTLFKSCLKFTRNRSHMACGAEQFNSCGAEQFNSLSVWNSRQEWCTAYSNRT